MKDEAPKIVQAFNHLIQALFNNSSLDASRRQLIYIGTGIKASQDNAKVQPHAAAVTRSFPDVPCDQDFMKVFDILRTIRSDN